MPNLIEIQKDSYQWFLDEGLKEAFADISPITDYSGKLSLDFVDFTLCEDDVKYTIPECKERDATYAAPLKVKVRLHNKETDEINEHEIFMGDLPLMTETGTFVINGAQSVVVVDYLGLTVAEDTQLRKQLREAGVTYKVYKNTLVNRAIQGTEFEGLKDVLEGPSAFAVSAEDATAPARILAKFAKTAPALEIKAGVVEGTFYDAEGMKAIAAVPSREELLGKLLGSIQSPITNLARVLNQIAEQGGAADAAVEAAPAEDAAEEAPAAE